MDGMSHIVIEVSDLKRSEDFYRLLGFKPLGSDRVPECGRNAVFGTACGQRVILSESREPRTLPETGVHQAYRVTRARRDAIAKRLLAGDVTVHDYKEDRPAEAGDNFYFYDPDGNRIQLVAAGTDAADGETILGIDHAAIECHDLEWAEDFYVEVLGLSVDHRVGWRTEDYVRARLWGEGKEHMAPGTRRWDQRYTVMEQKRRIPRPNTQLFVRAGDSVLGVYLATQHRQEPPEEQAVGTPRIGFRARREILEKIARLLAGRRFASRGPVEHSDTALEASLYVRDPGGNFLEICIPR
ncbi:MAG TPA: VOC family protein [Candidatus Acidoferrales bacterium]|nr:VOC family protein [Candidatus Acidoferrales bacterium]